MKKNYKIFFANIIIIGFCAIAFLLYEYFVGLAIVATSVAENLYEDPTTIQNIAKFIAIDGLIAVVLYIIISTINYLSAKKENKKALIVITVLCSIVLAIYVVKNIMAFF